MDKMKEKIRILHYIDDLKIAGTQIFLLNLYRSIDRESFAFDLIVYNPEMDLAEEFEKLGSRIYKLKGISRRNDIEAIKQWNEFFDAHREYKILHCHDRGSVSKILSIAKKHNVITIAHSHNTSNGSGLKKKLMENLQIPIRFRADYLFACSMKAGKWLFGKNCDHRKNYYVIKNGIDAKRFEFNSQVRHKIREELGLRDKIVLGNIGRFVEQKNQLFLLDILKILTSKDTRYTLLLVGNGAKKEEIISKIRELGLTDYVRLIEPTNMPEHYYNAMDYFIFPSLWEGLGIVAIEAQANGLPCLVSSEVPPEADIGADLIDYKSLKDGPEAWADKIMQMKNRRYDDIKGYLLKSGYVMDEEAKKVELCGEKSHRYFETIPSGYQL